MAWILFTLMAAFMQAWRNALQARLGKKVNVVGVTLARFLWASPIAALYLLGLYLWQPQPLPNPTVPLIGFITGAAGTQILATALMVKLFKMNNYAVGAGLAKSEALVAAILGMMFFGTDLSLLGWLGVFTGGVAVFLLSTRGHWRSISLATVLLGLACGASFAITSLWIREATLVVGLPFPHRAAWILLLVITLQTIILVGYLWLRDPQTLTALFQNGKLTVAISLCSCLGSLGWFSAMALQNVPFVKTLGQVEVFFMLLISAWWLKEKPGWREISGLLLIALAATLVLWADQVPKA